MSATRLTPHGGHDGSLGITDEEFDHDRAGVLARLRADGDLDFGPAVLDPPISATSPARWAPSRCVTGRHGAPGGRACSPSPPSWGRGSS
jgi:hypothetical protein